MNKFGTAILLAGGKSSRMGFDKQQLKVNNILLVEYIINRLYTVFDDIVVVTNNSEHYTNLPCRTVQDEIPGYGPLSGIHIGLKMAKNQYGYVMACDMPYINFDYIAYLKNRMEQVDCDACVTVFNQEWIEPFHGFYSKKLISPIEEYLKSGKRSVFGLLKNFNSIYIEEEIAREYSPNWDLFLNINTKEDLLELETQWSNLNM
ncbi:molybdenum cofactor guanylyltransferase [Alkalibaculum bacchi]|uniref:Probable molybdenum cofactor guanylyltransferase n=1 Tax=Alkalibaculum bacchi TaxID=645887 RepID=A0A366IDC8_9FIRM|nr:molybdenum cofactor guanylyltransferase [Alkalibaculum bacchi]RBP68993.1 molybdenum cofactor guanylyltransferase [Alkalibaculum bacchi]